MAKSQQQPTGPGQQTLTIDYNDFIKGMGTTDYTNDAGFSPNTIGVNLLPNVGIVGSTAVPVDIIGSVGGGIVATTPDDNTGTVFAIGTDSKFYNSTGGAFGSALATSTNTFASYYSDFIEYGVNSYFASTHQGSIGSATDTVVKFNGGSIDDDSWFHTNFKVTGTGQYLNSGVPHPMAVCFGWMFIADGNQLHRYVIGDPNINGGAAQYTYGVLQLAPGNTITALGADPYSGKLMVAYSTQYSVGGTGTPAVNRIGLYDGSNISQFQKLVIVDDAVTAIRSHGGQLFIFYGYALGTWNGNGITWVRSTTQTITKQQVTNIGNDLYYIDGLNLIVYTEVVVGKPKVFWNMFNLSQLGFDTSAYYSAIFNLQSSKLGMAYATTLPAYYIRSLDITTAGASTQSASFYSNKYNFPRRVWIRAIDVILNAVPTTGTHTLSYIDDSGSLTSVGVFNNSLPSAYHRFYTNIKTTIFQLLDVIASSKSLNRVIIYYDLYE